MQTYLMSSLVVTILSFQVIKLRLDAVKGQRGKNIKINNCNPYQGLVVGGCTVRKGLLCIPVYKCRLVCG